MGRAPECGLDSVCSICLLILLGLAAPQAHLSCGECCEHKWPSQARPHKPMPLPVAQSSTVNAPCRALWQRVWVRDPVTIEAELRSPIQPITLEKNQFLPLGLNFPTKLCIRTVRAFSEHRSPAPTPDLLNQNPRNKTWESAF